MADVGNFIKANIGVVVLDSPYAPLYPTYKQRLSGITYFDGVGSAAKIVVVGENGEHIYLTYTDANGVWEIKGIARRWTDKPIMVISIDEIYNYNAEIFSNVFAVE